MSNTEFSIIMCTYNGGKKINKVIDSVIYQNGYDKYVKEFIIVNNSSTDDTSEIIKINLHKSEKIVSEIQPLQGLSYARLKGIETCKSNWIIFIDDDNLLSSEWIEDAYRYIENNKLVGAFNGSVIPFFEETLDENEKNILKNVLQGLACTNIDIVDIDMKKKYHPYRIPFGAGLVIRTEPLKQLASEGWLLSKGRTGESLISCEDTEMCLFIKKSGYSFGYNPEMVINHLISKDRLELEYLTKLWKGFANGNFNLLKNSKYGNLKNIMYLYLLYIRSIKDIYILFKNKSYKIKYELNKIYRKEYVDCLKKYINN